MVRNHVEGAREALTVIMKTGMLEPKFIPGVTELAPEKKPLKKGTDGKKAAVMDQASSVETPMAKAEEHTETETVTAA